MKNIKLNGSYSLPPTKKQSYILHLYNVKLSDNNNRSNLNNTQKQPDKDEAPEIPKNNKWKILLFGGLKFLIRFCAAKVQRPEILLLVPIIEWLSSKFTTKI